MRKSAFFRGVGLLAVLLAAVPAGGGAAFAYTNNDDITVSGTGTQYGINKSEAVTNNGNVSVTATDTTGDAIAYGINESASAAVTNNGTISSRAASSSGDARAFGIYGTPNSTVTNSGTITAQGTSASGTAGAYGIYGSSGTVTATNSGTITATGTSTSGAAYAAGIYTYGSATNSGTITARATNSGGSTLTSYGIYAGTVAGLTVSNSGTISATAVNTTGSTSPNAYGIFADAVSTVTNSGTITTAATSASGDATAYGVYSNSGSTVTNTGTITTTAASTSGTALAIGIYPSSGTPVTNSGTIETTATAASGAAIGFGIDATAGSAALTNNGTITSTVTSVSSVATAYGIRGESSPITNNGTITTKATSSGDDASSYAIYTEATAVNCGSITAIAVNLGGSACSCAFGIYGDTNSTVINSGYISAAATSAGGMATSYGIYSGSNGTVTNSGTIASTATSTGGIASAYGIYALSGNTVKNSGTITVSVSSGAAASAASGIYFSDGGTLTNTGMINASAGNAYEVDVAGGTVTLANRYNMTLDGTPSKGSIRVASGATFDINSALLSLSAGSGAAFNTAYKIFNNSGTVNGAFSGVSTANPAVSAVYNNQGTAASSGDDTVMLTYHPRTSAVLEGANTGRRAMDIALSPVRQEQIRALLEGFIPEGGALRLASAGTVASDAPQNLKKVEPGQDFYVVPYYSRMHNSSENLGSDTTASGVALGYNQRYGRSRLGLHMGLLRAESNYTGSEFPSSTKTTQDIISFGGQGVTRWGNWTLRGDVTGFYGRNDYSGITGVNFEARETGKYNSLGTMENVAAGYAFKMGNSVILPEIGLTHLWMQQEGFAGTYSAGGWPTSYGSLNNNMVRGEATVRWLSSYAAADFSLTPTVAVGGRYRLTNDNLSLTQTVPGSLPVSVASDQERKAAIVQVALRVKKQGNLSVEAAYNGEYSQDMTSHGGWLKLLYAF